MFPFTYDALPGRVVFGAGSARTQLTAELDSLGGRRVMLIVTESGQALAQHLTAPFADRLAAVFTGVRQHVPMSVAEEARTVATSEGADLLLCIGGGSTTGTAKAVALTNGLPIVAVPTTYAGSEVTPVWGVTEGSRKTTGTDRQVLPRTVIYDPELTLTLPPELSAASGLNAMAHSVEAFWAPGRNPISSLAAEESVRAIASGLPLVVVDPDDITARSDLMYGAALAGSAFAITGSGLHHKICHVLGGAYDLPHALTHAIVLPHVLAFNAPAVPDVIQRIGRALGSDDPVATLFDLTAQLGIPNGLRDVGLREDQIDEAAGLVADSVPADNPRPVDREAIRQIIRLAWAGAVRRRV